MPTITDNLTKALDMLGTLRLQIINLPADVETAPLLQTTDEIRHLLYQHIGHQMCDRLFKNKH